MKYLVLSVVLFSTISCTIQNSKGELCIGVLEKPKPGVEYRLSMWNAAVAILFSETVVIPLYTVTADIQCPVEK